MTEPARLLATGGLYLAGLAFIAICFTACTTKGPLEPADDAPPNPRDVSGIPNAVPRNEPLSRYGNPASYVVYGKRYHTLSSSKGYQEQGLASWYGTKFHGKRTSSGEPYDLYGMTAAHKTLPLPTYVEVTNLGNDRSVIVKVNDRGPFHGDRLIDLSYAAAVKLKIVGNGTERVEVRAIDTGTPATTTQAAPVAPAPVSQQGDTVLYLQVGAFSNRENAERLQEKILAEDIGAVRIIENTGDNGTFYKVQVGPLADATELDRVAKALKPLGINESRPIAQ
jgi:rare lipoprotein A